MFEQVSLLCDESNASRRAQHHPLDNTQKPNVCMWRSHGPDHRINPGRAHAGLQQAKAKSRAFHCGYLQVTDGPVAELHRVSLL